MQNLMNLIGGPVVGLLLLLSVVATTVIFYRLILQIVQREGSPTADILMAQLRGKALDPSAMTNSRAPRIQTIHTTFPNRHGMEAHRF